jgi:hypothetical protein
MHLDPEIHPTPTKGCQPSTPATASVIMRAVMTIASIDAMTMATDPWTTIPVRASTRAELEQLRTGGQNFDALLRALLEELESRDPWFDEMAQRIDDWRSGSVKPKPIETLRVRDLRSRKHGAR